MRCALILAVVLTLSAFIPRARAAQALYEDTHAVTLESSEANYGPSCQELIDAQEKRALAILYGISTLHPNEVRAAIERLIKEHAQLQRELVNCSTWNN